MKQSDVKESSDFINLSELFALIWKNKLWVAISSITFAVVAGFYSYSLPNIYKASSVLAPVSESSSSFSGMSSQLSGLAGMAGISLNDSSFNKTTYALEVMKSRAFIERFIEKNNLLVPLMAMKGWDSDEDKLLINEGLYDEKSKEWKPAKTPSLWRAYQKFSKSLSVIKDKSTSYITVSIDYFAPHVAKEWLTLFILDINNFIRDGDEQEARASIKYLNQKLTETSVSSMESVFYQLIEQQTKSMMLARVKKEYIFKMVEPPQVPEIKDSPKRSLIVLIGFILGGFLAVFSVLLRFVIKSNKS